MKKAAIIILLVVSCWLLVVGYAHAEPISLSVTPSVIELVARAPDNLEAKLTIANESDLPVELETELLPFTPLGEEGKIQLVNTTLPIKDLITIDKSVMLRPREKKDLTLNILIPPDQPEEDYYFTVAFIQDPTRGVDVLNPQELRAHTNVRGGVGVNVLLAIKTPQTASSLQIDEFKTSRYFNSGPVPFTLRVANNGKHWAKVRGQVIITNMFGQKIGLVNIPEETVLAQNSRQLNLIFPEKVLLGMYTAEVLIDNTDRNKIFFFALPGRYGASIIVILVIIAFFAKRVKSKLRAY